MRNTNSNSWRRSHRRSTLAFHSKASTILPRMAKNPPSRKAVPQARQLAQRLKSMTSQPTKPPALGNSQLEAKILSGETLSKDDKLAVSSLLQRFTRLSKVVRRLSNAKTSEANAAGAVLALETYSNAEHLRSNPHEGIRMVASSRLRFPLLVSVRPQSRKMLLEQLDDLGVGEGLPPGFDKHARWKNDVFAEQAEVIYELWQSETCNMRVFSEADWAAIEKLAETEYFPWVFRLQGVVKSVFEEMKKALPVGDTKPPGRARARIKFNVMARLRGMLGLKMQ